jgi:hypothetical protein
MTGTTTDGMMAMAAVVAVPDTTADPQIQDMEVAAAGNQALDMTADLNGTQGEIRATMTMARLHLRTMDMAEVDLHHHKTMAGRQFQTDLHQHQLRHEMQMIAMHCGRYSKL